MQQYDEIQEHRLQQMERMVNVLVEGQSTLAQISQEQVKRMDRLDSRMDRFESRMDRFESRMDGLESRMDGLESRIEKVEELLTLVLDDLAYIKELLRSRDGGRSLPD